MTELKTLKDIGAINSVLKNELKAEAVKWVKYMNKQEDWIYMVYERDWEGLFKHFFNLTEEDLK
jgi:hypothetical protein